MSRLSGETQHRQLVGVALGWARVPLHQCKLRHIAGTSAWRQSCAEPHLPQRWRGIRALVLRVPHDSQINTATDHQTLSKWTFFFSFMRTVGASPQGTERASSLCAPRSAKDLRSSGLDRLERSAADRNTMKTFWGGCSPTSNLCFPWPQPELFSPWAGILLSAILFSPRSLLPGQMNTNAFRSPTDKEWTRFRGSNVSGPLFFHLHHCAIAAWKRFSA